MTTDKNNIFLDKIALSISILDKEGQLVGLYNTLLSDAHVGYIKEQDLLKDRNSLAVLRTLKDLYDIIKNNKIKDIVITQKDLKPEEDIIISVVNKFKCSLEKHSLTFLELDNAYNAILNFVSLYGYHDDQQMGDKTTDEDALNW